MAQFLKNTSTQGICYISTIITLSGGDYPAVNLWTIYRLLKFWLLRLNSVYKIGHWSQQTQYIYLIILFMEGSGRKLQLGSFLLRPFWTFLISQTSQRTIALTRCKGNTSPSKNVRLKIIESAICLDWHLPKERSGNGKSLLKIDSSSKVGLLF